MPKKSKTLCVDDLRHADVLWKCKILLMNYIKKVRTVKYLRILWI